MDHSLGLLDIYLGTEYEQGSLSRLVGFLSGLLNMSKDLLCSRLNLRSACLFWSHWNVKSAWRIDNLSCSR